MDGAARDLHAGRERVAHRVPALERGQQRRVGVDARGSPNASTNGSDEDRPEAGDRDEIDVVALRARPRLPCVYATRSNVGREVGALHQLAPRSRPPRAISRAPQGRSASTTATGSRRSSIACRMVPLPEARTPTRMLGTLSPAPVLVGGRKSPEFRPKRVSLSQQAREIRRSAGTSWHPTVVRSTQPSAWTEFASGTRDSTRGRFRWTARHRRRRQN